MRKSIAADNISLPSSVVKTHAAFWTDAATVASQRQIAAGTSCIAHLKLYLNKSNIWWPDSYPDILTIEYINICIDSSNHFYSLISEVITAVKCYQFQITLNVYHGGAFFLEVTPILDKTFYSYVSCIAEIIWMTLILTNSYGCTLLLTNSYDCTLILSNSYGCTLILTNN